PPARADAGHVHLADARHRPRRRVRRHLLRCAREPWAAPRPGPGRGGGDPLRPHGRARSRRDRRRRPDEAPRRSRPRPAHPGPRDPLRGVAADDGARRHHLRRDLPVLPAGRGPHRPGAGGPGRRDHRPGGLMDYLTALLLGLVQGLTEFLPISSSAHISIVGQLVGQEDPGAAFTAITQLGTEAAVVLYFWRDITTIIRKWSLA